MNIWQNRVSWHNGKKSYFSGSGAWSKLYRGLPLVVGNLSTGWAPRPILHLLSSLPFSPAARVDSRATMSPCLCPKELPLLTGLPRWITGLVQHLEAVNGQWTDTGSSTWLCPPCLDPAGLCLMGQGKDCTDPTPGCLLFRRRQLTPGQGMSTFQIAGLKPGSQRNHDHQPHDWPVWRLSLIHLSS